MDITYNLTLLLYGKVGSDTHTPWQCSNEHTEGWILVTVVAGHCVTTGITRLAQGEHQCLSGACTSLDLIKNISLHCKLLQESKYSI
jgi:hypothetical protein